MDKCPLWEYYYSEDLCENIELTFGIFITFITKSRLKIWIRSSWIWYLYQNLDQVNFL